MIKKIKDKNPQKNASEFNSLKLIIGNKNFKFSIISVLFILIIAFFTAIFYPERYVITSEPVMGAIVDKIYKIDGNRNGDAVIFNHKEHIVYTKKINRDCKFCHHLNRPNEEQSSCYKCHRDMTKVTNMFDHAYHIELFPKGNSCNRCHKDNKSKKNLVICGSCHIEYVNNNTSYTLVVGYKNAMHGTCRKCHVRDLTIKDSGSYCSTCHKTK